MGAGINTVPRVGLLPMPPKPAPMPAMPQIPGAQPGMPLPGGYPVFPLPQCSERTIMSAITPTVGRKVWFRPNGVNVIGNKLLQVFDPEQALDATVVCVCEKQTVNLLVVDHAGEIHSAYGIMLVQAGVYQNDRQVREKHVYHAIDRKNPRTEIIVQSLAPQIDLIAPQAQPAPARRPRLAPPSVAVRIPDELPF